jgi:hypothetical protein
MRPAKHVGEARTQHEEHRCHSTNPSVASHNDEVLTLLGFTGEAIDHLRTGGAIPHAAHLEGAATARRP